MHREIYIILQGSSIAVDSPHGSRPTASATGSGFEEKDPMRHSVVSLSAPSVTREIRLALNCSDGVSD